LKSVPSGATALALLLVTAAPTPRLAARATRADAQAPAAAAAQGKEHPELPDTSAETCRTCHDDKFGGPFAHGSTSGPTCSDCHVFEGSGDAARVRLAEGATRDASLPLCAVCHDDVAAVARGAHAHGPLAAGDCLACHALHGSNAPHLLKHRGPQACTSCHDDVGKELERPVTHAPAATDCALCHAPHGSEAPAHLRAEVNTLCLGCHTSGVQQALRTEPATLFDRAPARGTAALLAPASRILLDPLQRRGHPIGNHPVRAAKDPNDERRPLTCVSCHAPHASERPSLERFGTDPTDFCTKCHK
jgi:predicted CXXCH cytochrome family protein